jgi:hypothetical protein
MTRRVLLGLHDKTIKGSVGSVCDLADYEVEYAQGPEEMVERARSEEHVRYIMDANFGVPGGEDINPSLRVWEVVRDRVERGEAKFIAVSARQDVVEAADVSGMPSESTISFGFERINEFLD